MWWSPKSYYRCFILEENQTGREIPRSRKWSINWQRYSKKDPASRNNFRSSQQILFEWYNYRSWLNSFLWGFPGFWTAHTVSALEGRRWGSKTLENNFYYISSRIPDASSNDLFEVQSLLYPGSPRFRDHSSWVSVYWKVNRNTKDFGHSCLNKYLQINNYLMYRERFCSMMMQPKQRYLMVSSTAQEKMPTWC